MHFPRLSPLLPALLADLDRAPPPPPPASTAETGARITRLLAALGMPAAAVKIVRYQELSGTGEIITARPLPCKPTDYIRGFRLQTLSQPTRKGRALPAHKTLNYLENLLARRAARAAGFDEALFVTPCGTVLEGSASTLFIVKHGLVLTPPLALGILPGVMRAAVLAHLGPQRAREEIVTRDELLAADEVFVTNALMGVMPVVRIDAHEFDQNAPVITALRAAGL
ncbi:aminotransferase class IV [Opitutaceae bacterium TAV3]|nr:aminotransferase class IV [Opitutaceae bacterium TAV3]